MPLPWSEGQLVHEGIIGNFKQSGHFSETANIQAKTGGTRNDWGESADPWQTVHENIPCQYGVPRMGMVGREADLTSGRITESSAFIYFDRHLPDVTTKHRVVYQGRTLNISAVGHVQGNLFTWVAVDEVT